MWVTDNEIIFNIAIESYHPNSAEYSTLTLIECKDYNSLIQVDKLRNFKASIDDVGGRKGYGLTQFRIRVQRDKQSLHAYGAQGWR